nr:hypothetical protein CFP56_29932 [Quercus suber]
MRIIWARMFSHSQLTNTFFGTRQWYRRLKPSPQSCARQDSAKESKVKFLVKLGNGVISLDRTYISAPHPIITASVQRIRGVSTTYALQTISSAVSKYGDFTPPTLRRDT